VDRFIKLLTGGRPVPRAVEVRKGDAVMTLAEVEAWVGRDVSAGEGADDANGVSAGAMAFEGALLLKRTTAFSEWRDPGPIHFVEGG
jgi:hypothetical protein